MRWAEKENARRRSAYEAWGFEDADLRSMRAAAASFSGSARAEFPGERIYLEVAGARVIDAPRMGALAPLGAPFVPPSAPAGPVPAGMTAGDSGTAVVTSRRVLFLGPGYVREWPYRALTGLTDDVRSPVTVMRIGDGAPSGVWIPPAAAKGFRFHLRLAVADAFGDRAGLVTQIDHLVAWHEQRRPAPPAPADPRLAPASAWWSPLRASMAGALALVLLLCVAGQFLPSTDDAARTGPAATTAAPLTGAAVAVPTTGVAAGPAPDVAPSATAAAAARTTRAAPHTTPAAPRTTPAVRRTTPAAARTTAAKPKPKPTKKPVDFCGAPANPFGYNFCGGSLITSPDADTCSYFSCIPAFWDGKGYMEQCTDDMVSMSGGRSGSCSHHGGNRRPVYRR
jgi:hypothetical protein